MKNKALTTDTIRTIERSAPRFISIVAIVALGISFFAGMNATAPDMYLTAQKYLQESYSMDIQVISTAGITQEDIDAVASINTVESAVGEKFVDGIVTVNGEKINDVDGSEMTIRAIALDMNKVFSSENDPSYMNRPQLVEGAWPTNANQCVVDASMLSTPDEFKIGNVLRIKGDGTDITSSLSNTEFTIVGIIRTPLYISYERGATTIGTGKLGTFCYVPEDNFLNNYYSAMSIKLSGTEGLDPYGEQYKSILKTNVDYISQIAPELIAPRIDSLKTEYTVKVADAEAEYATTKADVDLQIENGQKQVEQILDMAQNGDRKLLEYKQQYDQKAAEAANTIDASKLEHSTQYAQWEQKRNEYNEAKQKVEQNKNAESQLQSATTEYNVANLQVNSLLTTVTYFEDLIAATRSAMDNFNDTQDNSVGSIIERFEQAGLVGPEVDQIVKTISSLTAVGTAEEMMAYMEPQLQTLEVKLAASKSDLQDAKTELAQKKVELEQAEQQVAELKRIEQELSVAEVELAQAEKELTQAGYDIQFGELEVLSQLSDMKNQITAYETNLALAKEKADTVEAEFEQAKNDANDKLEMAKNQLEQAKKFLLNLDKAKWYVNDRSEALLGFEQYGQMAKRMAALSMIFPWFFFIVAALVCLNTMTRMIEEERTRLGTFKALGFTDKEIMSKYLIYAFSSSAIGSVSGSFLGFALFPTIFSYAFKILFDMPNLEIKYHLTYAVPGILISIASTVFVTWYTCHKSLSVVPATLMRPKAPKGGKRVFLERFPFIWSNLSFTWKITMRNVFRNKKRFLMAALGVAGCTALLLAGFGLDSSLDRTLQYQFTNDDCLWNYDMQVVLNGSYDTTITSCDAYEAVNGNSAIANSMLNFMSVYNTTSENAPDKLMETYLYVPENETALSNYITLRDRKTGTPHFLSSNGAIITEKLSEELDVKAGGTIRLMIDEDTSVDIPVAAVAENYTFHYVYLTKDLYASVFGSYPAYNYITANLAVKDMNGEQKNALAKDLTSNYEISAVAFKSQIETSFANILDSISLVVIVLIISAGLLCFIVLYNLSIINITERTKEIATIKVLGFDNGEVSSYIFRENLILTLIGTAVGLLAGIVLHSLVLDIAEVDILMYGRGLQLPSFLLAAALSFGFSLIVNLALHKKLKSVDMVESLKSIE